MKNRLAEFRRSRGLTQAELSHLSNVSLAQLYRIENYSKTTLPTAKKLVTVLKYPVFEVFPYLQKFA